MKKRSCERPWSQAGELRQVMSVLVAFISVVLVIVLSAPRAVASAANIYIAQNSAGAANGGDCANALPASWFNSQANWGTGATQIGAGTTVHLCGTITTNLTFQANGTAGNPVILDGTGATASMFINTGTSYWTIQNVTWSTAYATNSPNQAAIQTQGGAAFGTIQNNTIDITNSAQVVFLGAITHDITAKNNFFRIITSGDGFDTDIFDTEGSYNVTLDGNYMELNVGIADNNQHDDVIQTWAKSGQVANAPHDWTIRYNKIVMNSNAPNNRSWCMIENMGGVMSVYGNLFLGLAGATQGNGCSISSAGSGGSPTQLVYGNTYAALNGSMTNVAGCGDNMATPCTFRNNIIYMTSSGTALGGEITTRDHNLWFGSSNIPTCTGHAGEICAQDPLFINTSTQNFGLQASSPAILAALNLGAPYNQAFQAGTTWPGPPLVTRAVSGAWDAGAFQSSSVSIQPPFGLSITVQ